MAIISKSDIDLNVTCVNIKILLKGFRQELNIYTLAAECMDFVDWLNNNEALESNKVEDKEKFNNKYYIFNDYKKRSTVCVNKNEIKYFEIPFFADEGKNYNYKILVSGR